MTNYPLLTETSLTADWVITKHTDYLGYELLGWVISLNSILPNPGLDYSTSPGGQMHSLLPPGSSLALLQAALWQEERNNERDCGHINAQCPQMESPFPNMENYHLDPISY